jgi:dTDP-4-dehydrorhamnose 3,5-epimerase-like enzyme
MTNESNSKSVKVIDFSIHGNEQIGFIGVFENHPNMPFAVERVFWTFQTPEEILRGRHAHRKTEQVLIALQGIIRVTTEMPNGEVQIFTLDHPSKGLYIPPQCWHTMQYTGNAIQLVLASTSYNESDYLRDYQTYKSFYKHEE